MTSIINASISSNGIVSTADASGILKIQSNGVTTNALAWVNFGYVSSAITTRASYNISSITRSATGDYIITFSNAMTDVNFVTIGTCSPNISGSSGRTVDAPYNQAPTTTTVRISTTSSANTNEDQAYISIAIFGN